MKRALFQNVKVAPYASGGVIDHNNFLSLILAAQIATAGTLTLTVTHADAPDGTFIPAPDMRLEANDRGTFTTNGVITIDPVNVGDLVNVDIDLVGSKQYLQIAISGSAAVDAVFAYAIGDAQYAPV
jgi:hypothetical protein